MKILHLSDLHFRDRDAEEADRCAQAVLVTARNERPDLIVIAGDVFDSRDVRMESRAASLAIGFISSLASIAPVAIVQGTPSHDGNAPAILRHVRGDFPIVVADRPMQVGLWQGEFLTLPTNGSGPDAIISLLPQPTKQYFATSADIEGADREIGAALSGIFAGFGAEAANYPGVPHILVYHGGISGARLPSGQVRTGMDIEVSTDQMMLANPDLVLCGHIHQAQQVGSGPVFYSGPIYATKVDEQGCGFYVHDDVGHDTMTPVHRFIPTPYTRTVRVSRDLTDEQAKKEPWGVGPVAGASLRFEFTVWQDEAETIDREAIRKEFMDQGAADVDIRVTRIPRETVRAEAVLRADTLRQKIESRAGITGEQVDPAVLAMADLLEGTQADLLLRQVMEGGKAA